MHSALITGGFGALGRATADHFRSVGYEVVCCGRHVPPNAEGMRIDVTDFGQLFSAIKAVKPAVILHFAASFSNDFEQAFATNVRGAHNLFNAVNDMGIKSRLVLAGSAAEYGLVAAEENPIAESRALVPVSLYGVTKSWQTTLGLMHAFNGLDVVIARIFNLDGDGLPNRLFVGQIEEQIRELRAGRRERIVVGSLDAVRDYVRVEQAATQLRAIAEHGIRGEVYHVASGHPVAVRDLLRTKLEKNNLSFEVVDECLNASNRPRYNVPVIFADMKKTLRLIDGTKP